jgi:hypothetical protein
MKRSISLIAIAALVGGLVAAQPATAQTVVPETANITDPPGDANGHSSITGQGGGAYVGAADFLKIWFTHDAANLNVHIQTTSPAFTAGSIWYSIYVDPGVGSDCMEFRGYTQHQAVTAHGNLILTGDCGELNEAVEFKTEEGPEIEGAVSGVHTLTVPRSLSEHLGNGKTLASPSALDRYYAGTDPTGGVGLGILDDTEVGTPYVIAEGGSSAGETKKEPSGKADPPGKGKKKGCPKGKGKKKGACPGRKKPKPPKPAKCAPYLPGEEGKDAPLTLVTPAHTEEAPVQVEVETSGGLPEVAVSEVFQNLQVDSTTSDAGLWVKVEFADFRDYDLYLNHPDGSRAAFSGQAQVAPTGGLGSGSEGGHEAGTNYEMVTGVKTADCAGYTARIAGYMTEGGTVTLSAWLGEAKFDPEPPGGGGALGLFYELIGL